MTDDELKAIEARANAATPGPWWNGLTTEYGELVWFGAEKPYGECRIAQDIGARVDANFISHARTDIPALIAELRAAREALRNVRSLAQYCLGPTRDVKTPKLLEIVSVTNKALGEE